MTFTLSQCGLALDIIGVLFLSSALAITSNRMISALAGTYWDMNSALARELVRNRTDAMIGLPILIAGFGLQALGTVFHEPISIYAPALFGAVYVLGIALGNFRSAMIAAGAGRVVALALAEQKE